MLLIKSHRTLTSAVSSFLSKSGATFSRYRSHFRYPNRTVNINWGQLLRFLGGTSTIGVFESAVGLTKQTLDILLGPAVSEALRIHPTPSLLLRFHAVISTQA